jgi:prepilin-type N-terminal cleavage/methylation domain-containing protein
MLHYTTAQNGRGPGHRSGFSLIELLVTVVILAVILALGTTVIRAAYDFAKNLQYQADSTKRRLRPLPQDGVSSIKFIPDQFILMLRDDVDPRTEAARLARVAPFKLLDVYTGIYKGIAINATADNLKKLLSDPAVRYIEQDQLITVGAQMVPSGVRRIGADRTLAGVASRLFTRGDPTVTTADVDATIVVIDTGVAEHEDLNVVLDKGFGKLEDSPGDRNGHGTHVAGIAAARDNDLGVVGVAPGARIWSLKVLDGAEGGGASGSGKDVQAALDFVLSNASEVSVVNMSLGTSGAVPSLDAAVERLVRAGVTVVVAAGNDRKDASRFSPGRAANAITVAALDDTSKPGVADKKDRFASFSNYGKVIDVVAPGVRIRSTWLRDEYKTLSGTSMAAPHVAGVAALIKAKYPADSPQAVVNRMRTAATERIKGPAKLRYRVVNARPFVN